MALADEAVETFRSLSQYASLTSGHVSNSLNPGHIQVASIWSQRDLDRKENIYFSKNYFIQGFSSIVATQPQEISQTQFRVISPSGNYVAGIRKVDQKEGDEKQFVEIWNNNHRLHNISIEALDQHGKIYDDSSFGCLQWSHDETRLVYVAERKKPKAKSYFEQTSTHDKTAESSAIGDEFVYEDDWGEEMTGKACSVVCIMDIESRTVRVLDYLPDDVCAGHVVWCPDDLGLICVGTFQGPFRLGKIYCPTRKSVLYHIDLKTSKCEVLGKTDQAVDSPIFSPDGSRLVYLESNVGGPHCQCMRLCVCDWSTKTISIVQDIVMEVGNALEFPGLFTLTLNDKCWSQDSKRIVTNTQWRSKMELIAIHMETREVTRLTNDDTVGSWNLLDIHDDVILATCSSPNQPEYLVITKLPPYGQENTMKWSKLDNPITLPNISWEILSIDGTADDDHKTFSTVNYEYIIMSPVQADPDGKQQMIVFPHGGPHWAFSANFMLDSAYFCQLGYIVICVNYRGSTGFGQDSILSLPGRIGTQDVQDVHRVAVRVMKTHNVDPNRVCAMGGSHGGFLSGHLIGQYPDFYKAAAMLNPVINIASMVGATDLPDWSYVETGLQYSDSQVSLGSPTLYEKAWNMSPIRYADQISAAVLLCIGEIDRRCPPKQSHEYRKALLAHGATVKMLSYPENSHPLSKVDSEADRFVNIFRWFSEHIG